ncbi:hypothetical protein Tcan_11419 [Toxocara canis]|uniref:Uncharacterized protein n=1 Tax=Toxocara canis TaxID=6265 RepID=A0A0B2VTM0_TOXCA|nr:hypothetical protein Tcan_11419 [Toxocara canis]
MIYGIILLVVFVYIAVKIHLRLRERGEEGLPVVGDFVEIFFEKYRNRSSEMVIFDGPLTSRDDEMQLTNATQSSKSVASFSPSSQKILTSSTDMDTSSSEGGGESGTSDESIKKFKLETPAIKGN